MPMVDNVYITVSFWYNAEHNATQINNRIKFCGKN